MSLRAVCRSQPALYGSWSHHRKQTRIRGIEGTDPGREPIGDSREQQESNRLSKVRRKIKFPLAAIMLIPCASGSEIRRRFPSLTMLDLKPVDQSIPIPKVDSQAAKSFIPNKPPLSIAGRADRKNAQTNGSTQAKHNKVSAPVTVQPAFKDSDASQNAMSQFLVK